MKKGVIILILIFTLGLVGCKGSSDKGTANNNKPSQTVVDNNSKTSTSNEDTNNTNEQEDTNTNTNTQQESSSGNQDKTNTTNQTNTNTQNSNPIQKSTKQEYLAKLAKVESDLIAIDKGDESTNGMLQYEAASYKKWDAALNEIYGVLKKQLSANDMKKLQAEEIQWIKDKDAKAKKDSSEMKGGSMEPVLSYASLSKSTRERCYTLVNNYMK